MKKTAIAFVLALMLGVGFFGTEVSAQMGPGGGSGQGYGPQQQGWYCPYCGRWEGPRGGMGGGMMGPGMMGRGMMGPGMMGPGMMGPGMMGRGMMGPGMGMGQQYGPQYGPGYQGPQYQQPTQPLDKKKAKDILQNYILSTRNPNLRLGTIADKGSAFEVEIVTKKEGALVDRIAVDKLTGWVRSVY